MTAFLPIVRSATLEGFTDLAAELGLDASALLRQAGLQRMWRWARYLLR